MHYIVGAVVGYLAGIVTPGVIRRIRAEAKQGVTFAEVEVKKTEAEVKSKL